VSSNSDVIRNTIATAALGLFGWHMITLHNIAKSVEVLIEKVEIVLPELSALKNKVISSLDEHNQRASPLSITQPTQRQLLKRAARQRKLNTRRPPLKMPSEERWTARRRRGIAGKGGPDLSHTKKGTMVLESPSRNRARNGHNGKSTKK